MELKIRKALFLIFFSMLFMLMDSYAFHTVSEILPNNLILICKDFDQVRTGQKVEVYQKKFSEGRSGREIVKTDEFLLPKEGQTIELHHIELHRGSRFFPEKHSEKLGTATVVAPKIKGEMRIVDIASKGRRGSFDRKTVEMTAKDEESVAKNCIVAKPNKEIKLKDVTSITF